jgi:hypothetical protein
VSKIDLPDKERINELIDRAIDLDQKMLLELELLALELDGVPPEDFAPVSRSLQILISNTNERAGLLKRIRSIVC